ncbi:MAG: hypothetical protein OHK0039_03660 [Bacteroidia bacterium]
MKIATLILLLMGACVVGLHAQTETDCRLRPEDLRPLIVRFNPYFSDHEWDAESQMELARMGRDRLLVIAQEGCKRHHTTFTLVMDPSAARPEPVFWLEEVKALLHKVYWEQPVYEEFGKEFEKAFEEKFRLYGLGRAFNFPIGTRNFICEVRYDPHKGGRISIEMVSFIFLEKVQERRAGGPDEDDGWLGVGNE